jgi:hypothetical protein
MEAPARRGQHFFSDFSRQISCQLYFQAGIGRWIVDHDAVSEVKGEARQPMFADLDDQRRDRRP